jgi:hypothetical protein
LLALRNQANGFFMMRHCEINNGTFFAREKPSMSNDVPIMPDPVEKNSFIPTLDPQGAIWLYVDEITQAYLDFAGKTKGTLLEVAAGYGHIVIKALEAGAGKVFANEIDADQLAIIKSRTPAAYSDKRVVA